MSSTETPVLATTGTYKKLSGTPLRLAQAVVVFIALFTVGLFIRAIPLAFQGEIAQQTPVYGEIIQEIGLRMPLYAGYMIGLDALSYAVFVVTGLAIINRRPDDIVSLASALMLVTWGAATTVTFFYAADLAPVFAFSAQLISNTSYILFVWFLYTAPNGEFNPKWTKFVVIGWTVYILALIIGGELLISSAQIPVFAFIGQVVVYVLSFVVINYRLEHVFTETEEQQFKWVAFGLAVAFVVFMIRFLPPMVISDEVLPPAVLLAWDVLSWMLMRLGLAALPLALAFSIMRYRLWDVDLVLNRSLVYGGVTVLVAVITLTDFFGFLWLLRLITGGEQPTLAVALGTAVAVGLFTPLRNGIQNFVDRKLFGIGINYRKQPKKSVQQSQALDDTDTFGPYQVLGPVGRGGMASVYRGYHPTLNRTVAIKVLADQLAEQADFRTRFEREAQTIANLAHPNIVQVFDFGNEANTYYMIMEFIEGPTLSQMIKARGALPFEETAAIVADIASALDYAHMQGVIHRDVKPSNVMLRTITGTSETDMQQAILTDFGIAKIASHDSITRTGMMGTLDYIAPEQIKAAADVDGRADIYALGVMTYQLLTGALPFSGDNPGATVMAHLSKPAPNATEHNPAVPPHASFAVIRALAKDPADRFTTATAFANHLMEKVAVG